jgi:DNA-binding transcriptional LysR family regulator
MNIDYRYLKAFHLVGELLNFSKAAKELKIAQSAVSRQIKLLEEALAEQLIIRSSKKVILTDKGKELYNLINQFEMQTQKIFFHEEEQVIRVGILHGLLENWFIKVIEAFNKKSKNPITVQIGTPDDLGKRLIKGEIDVIFTSGRFTAPTVAAQIGQHYRVVSRQICRDFCPCKMRLRSSV